MPIAVWWKIDKADMDLQKMRDWFDSEEGQQTIF